MEEHVEHLRKVFQRLKENKLYVKLEKCKFCCNLNLGLATKARACKSAGQEGSQGVTFQAPRSAKECDGMNPHTPKGTPTSGVGVPVDS